MIHAFFGGDGRDIMKSHIKQLNIVSKKFGNIIHVHLMFCDIYDVCDVLDLCEIRKLDISI